MSYMNLKDSVKKAHKTAVLNIELPGNHSVVALTDPGDRSEQQDRYLVTTVPDPAKVDFSRIFADIQTDLTQQLSETELESGAVVTAALVHPDGKVTTANLGDCRVSLFLHDKKRHDTRCFQLTSDLTPGKSSEKERIQNAGGFVMDNRLVNFDVGSLAVSAAMGDRDFAPWLKRDPVVKTHDFNPENPDFEFTLCVESDGSHLSHKENVRGTLHTAAVKESGLSTPAHLVQAFNIYADEYYNKIRMDILSDLAPEARERVMKTSAGDITALGGAEFEAYLDMRRIKADNRTIVATRLTPQMPGHAIVVIDGHGPDGAKVAQTIADLFQKYLSPEPQG